MLESEQKKLLNSHLGLPNMMDSKGRRLAWQPLLELII